MSIDGIPENIHQFIFEHIHSIEQLEILFLLREQENRKWSLQEISDELRTNSESVSKRLSTLMNSGLVKKLDSTPATFIYAPYSPELKNLITELANIYKIRRHRIYEHIFSPIKKAKVFSEAFTIEKPSKKK